MLRLLLKTLKKALNKAPETEQLKAVRYDRSLIQFIDNPSEKVQLMAVRGGCPWVIDLIKNPSERVQLMAIKKEPFYAIQFMKKIATDKVKLAALKKDWKVLEVIGDFSDDCKTVSFPINIVRYTIKNGNYNNIKRLGIKNIDTYPGLSKELKLLYKIKMEF